VQINIYKLSQLSKFFKLHFGVRAIFSFCLILFLAGCKPDKKANPAISSITPSVGIVSGGTTITIAGSDFSTSSVVSIGNKNCAIISASTTQIQCSTAANTAGSYSVVITNPNRQNVSLASGFTYSNGPAVTSIAPSAGLASGIELVTVSGNNFVSGATVVFGGVPCTGVSFINAATLTCTTGAHAAGSVNVVVTNPDTTSATKVSGFLYRGPPTVTSVSANAGALAGGTAVTITGTGFYTGPAVDFSGAACTGTTVVSSTSITCTTSAHVAGVATVTVTNLDTQTGSAAAAYTYQAAPTVTSVSANVGPLSGGSTATITGTNFLTGATVKFGASTCTLPIVVNATTIQCTTPAHAAGAVTVTVTNSDTQSGAAAAAYTYQPAPTVTSVSLNSGALAGGTAVTITGTGFVTGASSNFGGVACTGVTVVSATSITCTTPAHAAGLVSVSVTNADTQIGSANAFTYRAAPTVTSATPNAGALAGTTPISITGTGFYAGPTVTVGGSACTGVSVVNATTITCNTPAHVAGAVTIAVTNADSQSGSAAIAYTYQVAPTVTSLSPNIGTMAGGTAVTITGSDFVTGATVTIGGSVCTLPVFVNATTLQCTTPAHAAGAVSVVVKNTDNQTGTLAAGFTFLVPPTVTSVSLNAGALAGGTAVTLTGTNFVTGATVDFGGSACTGVTVVSSTSITCTTPAHAAGAVTVTVTNTDSQSGSMATAFTYRAAPAVTSAAPNSGALAGATSITITGTGFVTGATVDVGGSACTGVSVVNATTITCATPAHVAGAVTITVTNSDTQSGNAAAAYTYEPAPTVTSVAASSGFAVGGTAVTITGANFLAGATVTFGGSACTAITVVNATTITCTTPAHASGAVAVAVTNTDSQTGSAAGAFTYIAAPTVSSVSLNSGALAGGTAVTVTGTGFIAGAAVDFGGSACTGVTVVSGTSITCSTPAHAAGAVTVTVTNTDTQTGNAAAAFTYQVAPTVTSVAANAGALAGGTAVTITGTDFLTGATATFGGASCTSVVVVNATTITCTTPAHVAGAVTVAVTNADTQSGNAAAAYTYEAAPTVTSVAANEGVLAGGTSVTITGTNFLAGATVNFGASACTAITVVNATTITCTTPAHAAGAVSVSVTNTDSQSGSAAAAFAYHAPPTVTSVAANAGALAGGTAVTITGTNFFAGAAVDFGGSACTGITVVSTTSITCSTPAHVAGAVTVTITNTDTQTGNAAAAYTYQVAPSVTSVAANVGALGGGTAVTITGSDFLTGASVSFGGSACTAITVVNATTITCTTPAHAAGAVTVTVTNADTQSGNAAAAYTYEAAPAVTSLSPNSGFTAGGTAVTITGTGFLAGATVTVGGSACTGITVVSATSITCTTPAHAAGAVAVAVTNTDTQIGSTASAFNFVPAPTVTSVALNAGVLAGGTAVTVTGTGFLAGATVDFGGSACTGVSVVSATSITCTTPAHAAGAVTVTVTNADTQTGNAAAAFTYEVAPTVSSIVLSAGPLSGGATVTITGTDFVSGATVKIGGGTCTLPVFVNATTLQCTTPAHAGGAVDVVVTNPDTQIGTLTNGYMYLPAPTVTSVALNSGQTAGGTAVTITGTNFVAGATVDFGGSACTGVTIVSSTSITCTTPAHAVGLVSVSVTNTDTQVGSANAYTYRAAPTVTSSAPNSGALAGGSTITITGTGFYTGATVDVGGSACTGVSVVNATTLSCSVPAHVAGAVTITVTNADTQTGNAAAAYTYQAAPTVSNVTPSAGPISGGSSVTVTGTNFISGATITFGGVSCTLPIFVNATTLTCTTPVHSSGIVSVAVTNPDSQTGTLSNGFIYLPAPTVSSVAANSGALGGGTAVTITGTNFIAGATVDFSGSACTGISIVNSTTITCTTAAHAAGAVTVRVTNSDGQFGTANAYTYRAAPTVASASPNGGLLAGGALATITGSGFYTGASVDFGGSACGSVTVVNATTITCTVPAHAGGAVTITVTNADTQTGNAAAAYTYQAPPTFTSIDITSGFAVGGTAVSITGTGYLAGATVTFGGTACTGITVVNPTTITCTTAAHAAGAVNIVITNTDSQTVTGNSAYTYVAAPTVASISPSAGSIGGSTPVTINGTGFLAGASVDLGGVACTGITVVSATTITCTTGARAAAVVTVAVTNSDTQSGNLAASFTYQSMADLKWQVGGASPTPPNPDPYGSTNTNVTHTFTLKNIGDTISTTITVSVTGASPGAWLIGTDTCSGPGNELAPGASCTVQLTFLGQFLPATTSYTAILNATAASGGTTTNNLSGSVP
jgi:hypothetical protein